MESHPGIVFVKTVTGERRAALTAGPQVWTIAEAWQQHPARQRKAPAVAATLGLTDAMSKPRWLTGPSTATRSTS